MGTTPLKPHRLHNKAFFARMPLVSKPFVTFVLTIAALAATTTAVVLFAKGYRLSLPTKGLQRTGMISAKSYPEGAKVFVNGELTTVTNNPLTSLSPGRYNIKMVKEGYANWEKDVSVLEEMVTDVDALLISQTPKLEPLSSYGINQIAFSNDGRKIAFSTKNGEEPGIWLINLASGSPISLFKTKSQLLLADTQKIAYSLAEELTWSPDDSELLIKMNSRGYVLVSDAVSSGREISSLTNSEAVFSRWEKERLEKRLSFLSTAVEKIDIPENIFEYATSSATLWSPDERKFLYQKEDGSDNVEYRTYSLENPLPVGQTERDQHTMNINEGAGPSISWYSDNRHLVLVEGNTVGIIEVDGTNKTQVFSGLLKSQQVMPTLSGDKLIILTSFNPTVEPNIYTISLY